MPFDYDSLFNKSKLFIEKSIVARNAGHLDDSQMWAALGQEILAKAALARIHPALVADPTCSDSMFAACGRPVGSKRRSILAKTTYLRVRQLSPLFDQQSLDFCMLMAQRRNAQLHSGDIPYEGMKLDAWAPKYWSVCSVLLELQGKALNDWVDDSEAKRIEKVINARITALQHSVLARIEAKRREFLEKYPEGSKARAALQQQLKTTGIVWPRFHDLSHDIVQSEECPACEFQGGLACERMHDEPVEVESDEGWHYYLQVTYEALEFRCEACGLALKGREELEAADIDTQIEAEEEWQPDFEDSYMND